jgi:hypothetical protein
VACARERSSGEAPKTPRPGVEESAVNTEYGWIKFITKRTKDPNGYVYTSKLTDFPSITCSASTPEEALAACFIEFSKMVLQNGPA